MKVLWTANLIPANLSRYLGSESEVFGGWIETMTLQLNLFDDIELGVACKCEDNVKFIETTEGIEYYSLGYSSKTSFENLKNDCIKIIDDFSPDIIHIEGTEFLHSNAMLFAAKERNIPAVISLQGILNGYYSYQCGNLPIDDMMFSKSPANIFSAWIMHLRKTRWFKPRMINERQIIENAEYILGRTTWDKAHSYAINPNAVYYSCNRNLREPFYNTSWDINNINRHSIYVGNAYNALKGFHHLVEALPILIKEYPDIKVYVAGNKPYIDKDARQFIKKGYAVYLKKLINDLKLEKYIIFTGKLTAQEVADLLKKVNVYTLCSSIENSPNTLGEAMLVGTPCVAAYVGGVPDMATDGEEALLYRNDDSSLLAWKIKQVFDNDELALKLSENGKKKAQNTHNVIKNAKALRDAYIDILKKSEVK